MDLREEVDHILTYHYTSCHIISDSCIKMGRDESNLNVLLIVRDKVTTLCTNHNLSEET